MVTQQALFRLIRCLGLAFLAWLACPGVLQADWRDSFEGPEISWREAGGDARFQIENHQRVTDGARDGRWCEQLRVVGSNGSAVYLRHDVPAARIISELTASVWIKADRAGLQILVRAVLPRSQDPRGGGPVTTLLDGGGYTQTGNWQQLRIDNLPQRIERQLRVLRAQFGPSVDAREAYIDQVVLNVYGGPGSTNISIDDLELTGAVGSSNLFATPSAADSAGDFNPNRPVSLSNAGTAPAGGNAAGGTSAGGAAAGPTSPTPEVKWHGSSLLVAGKPFFHG